jgi:hypothetical protein
VPLCPQQILHDLAWARNTGNRGVKPTTTNSLSMGTAIWPIGSYEFEGSYFCQRFFCGYYENTAYLCCCKAIL